MDMHPLFTDLGKGEEALEASVATLSIGQSSGKALDGHAFDMLRQARITGHVPRYIAFEHVKSQYGALNVPPGSIFLGVDVWGRLQASHLLEGPIGLRRNWNHRFVTLESEWDNKLRHGCAAALMKKLASGMLLADASAVLRGHVG
ncbi:hypothetical protein COCOBI_07-6780 [Coccomyxa sp. Obi]|nr:hypothetical protein COCOBI_07-6780 [Coccomyxa sp. Obi]